MRKLGHGQDITTIRCELSAEEEVHEVYLTNHIYEVEKFTEEESKSVAVMVVPGVAEVVDENLDPVKFRVPLNNWQI